MSKNKEKKISLLSPDMVMTDKTEFTWSHCKALWDAVHGSGD